MKQLFFIIFSMLYVGLVYAGDSSWLTLQVTQSEIKEIALEYSTIALDIDTATAGGAPTDDTAGARYAVTIMPSAALKITGALDSNPPSGITLKANFSAPTGSSGTSQDTVDLSTSAADLVKGMATSCSVSDVEILFTMSNDGTAEPFGPTPYLFTATLATDT